MPVTDRLPVPMPRPGEARYGYKVILTRVWGLTPPALQTMLAIAARTNDLARLLALEAERGAQLDNEHFVTVRDGVATIPIQGSIFHHAPLFGRISGATSAEQVHADLQAALAAKSVQAILLDIDSPGGQVGGTAELAEAIKAAGVQKPVWAYISDEGCSAAYFIASAAQRIVVAPTAVVGNIGVVAGVPNPHYNPAGGDQPPDVTIFSSYSPNKWPDPTTQEGYDRVQATLDATCQVFLDAVAANRGFASAEDVIAAGQGGDVLVGQGAVNAALADAVGSYEGTLAELVASLADDGGAAAKKRRTRPPSLPPGRMPDGNPAVPSDDGHPKVQRLRVPLAATGLSQFDRALLTPGRAAAQRSTAQVGPGRTRRGGQPMTERVELVEDEIVADEGTEEEEEAGIPIAGTVETLSTKASLRLQVARLESERNQLSAELTKARRTIETLRAEALAGEAEREVSGLANDGIPWRGDSKLNAKKYIKMRQAFGADRDGFQEYVEDQRQAARSLEQGGLFGERGSDAPGAGGGAKAQLEALAASIMAEHRSAGTRISHEECMVEAMGRQPELAERFKRES